MNIPCTLSFALPRCLFLRRAHVLIYVRRRGVGACDTCNFSTTCSYMYRCIDEVDMQRCSRSTTDRRSAAKVGRYSLISGASTGGPVYIRRIRCEQRFGYIRHTRCEYGKYIRWLYTSRMRTQPANIFSIFTADMAAR